MSNSREQLRCTRRGCTYTTNRAFNLERHERNHDRGYVPSIQCQPCPHCTYAAGSMHNLMRHISKKHTAILIKKKPELLHVQEATHSASTSADSLNLQISPVKQLLGSGLISRPSINGQPCADSTLWYWNTPQQQEIIFLKRSGFKEVCKILGRNVKLFKLYNLVKARGGSENVNSWGDVAAALEFPKESGSSVRAKYMELLGEFEKKEEIRLKEWKDVEDVPVWWDDGDFITDSMYYTSQDGAQLDDSPASYAVRNTIVKMIFDKYYLNYIDKSKPFQRFQVKDSWLCATMLNYQMLKRQLHFKHVPTM